MSISNSAKRLVRRFGVSQRKIAGEWSPDKPWQDWSWTWKPWGLWWWSYQQWTRWDFTAPALALSLLRI